MPETKGILKMYICKRRIKIMAKWQRSFFQPVLPLGEDGRRVTGSKEHIALFRMAAGEGMVLLKNEKNTLPIRRRKSHSLVRVQ